MPILPVSLNTAKSAAVPSGMTAADAEINPLPQMAAQPKPQASIGLPFLRTTRSDSAHFSLPELSGRIQANTSPQKSAMDATDLANMQTQVQNLTQSVQGQVQQATAARSSQLPDLAVSHLQSAFSDIKGMQGELRALISNMAQEGVPSELLMLQSHLDDMSGQISSQMTGMFQAMGMPVSQKDANDILSDNTAKDGTPFGSTALDKSASLRRQMEDKTDAILTKAESDLQNPGVSKTTIPQVMQTAKSLIAMLESFGGTNAFADRIDALEEKHPEETKPKNGNPFVPPQ